MPGANPITGPNALSTQDLTGEPAGGGRQWECYEVPIEEVAHYGTRAVNLLERLGLYLWG